MLVFTALFTALGVHGWRGNSFSMSMAGVITGSIAWAAVVVVAVGLFHPSLGPAKVLVLNKVTGVMIAAFGVGTAIPCLLD